MVNSSADSRQYYLGVDGGGSKTLAIIVDEQGQECGRGLAGSANHAAIGLELALKNIYCAVEQAIGQSNVSIKKAWFGLAGVDRQADQEIVLPHLYALAPSVRLTNDAELALSALDQNIGIALIAGTGSIALGRNEQGQILRVGGWGHILGDEGSGYDIGRQALQAAVRAADGRGPSTLLLPLILKQWQLQSAEDIIGKVYIDNNDKASIAGLATCVLQAAEQGDGSAEIVIRQAVSELILQVKTLSDKLGFAQKPLSLAFVGGLLLYEPYYRQQVIAGIQDQQSIGQLVLVEQPALSAACAASKL